MFFKIKQYQKFLLKSTNQHGVHSPFIYDLVTKCFYAKEKKISNKIISSLLKENADKKSFSEKAAKLLNRIPSYFDHKKAVILSENYKPISEILSINNTIDLGNSIQFKGHYDLIYIDLNTLLHYLKTKSLLNIAHNNSTIITDSMYQSESNTIIWNKIKTHPRITVTVDTFSLGFVFIRKEQAKEHFTIRM